MFLTAALSREGKAGVDGAKRGFRFCGQAKATCHSAARITSIRFADEGKQALTPSTLHTEARTRVPRHGPERRAP